MPKRRWIQTLVPALLLTALAQAQGNSPYSRYGLGDIAPPTNISTRGMGGISAAYGEHLSVNFNNPASYTRYQVYQEARTKKVSQARVLLDVGINMQNRALRTPGETDKFSSTSGQFSYIHVGIPIRRGWGLSFGLRPLTQIGYNIQQTGLVTDPITGRGIDSALTIFEGSGGSYLPTIGTGFAIKNLSLGVNVGYLFGQRENERSRTLFDTASIYARGRSIQQSSFRGLYANAGLQYQIKVAQRTALRLGAYGNLAQTLKGQQDLTHETFVTDQDNRDFRIDSVFVQKDLKGDVEYPASYTVGFMLENQNERLGGWLVGADLTHTQWDDYRFFGQKDDVRSNWQMRLGGQFRPEATRRYFSNVAYRAGLWLGNDYIQAGGQKLPAWGVSLGAGLPLANYSALARGQATIINLALEYQKRGDNQNLVKENTFRLSVGFNFSDLWFSKRKYD